jgi:hypothetical protein
MRRHLRAIVVVVAALVVIVIMWRAIVPVYRAAARGRALAADIEARAARVSPDWRLAVGRVLADDALWAVLAPPRTTDAAPFLATIVQRIGIEPESAPPRVPERLAPRADDFFLLAAEQSFDDVDTGWMASLPTYTHWDLEDGPRGALPDAPLITLTDGPKIIRFLDDGRVRLAQGLANGDVARASEEVRALARLLYSTEDVLGAMIAVKLLEADDEVRGIAADTEAPVPGGRLASIDVVAKVFESAVIMFGPSTPPSLRQYEIKDARLCFAVAEGVSSYLLGREIYGTDDVARLAAVLEASPCALTRLRRQINAPTGGALPLEALGGKTLLQRTLLRAWLKDTLLNTMAPLARGYFGDDDAG